MFNKISFIIAASAAILCMTGCGTTKKSASNVTGPVKTETLGQTEGAISHVLYGEWTAFDVNGTAVTGEQRPYVIFDKSGDNPFVVKCYANNGCNTLNGNISVTPGGKMKPSSDFASTMRMCDDAPYEMGFNLALDYVTNYTIEQVGSEYLLYMKDDTGKNLMILRKADVGFMNGAWRVASLNGKEIAADKEMQMVLDLTDLKVHGNAGCNIMNGSLYIDQSRQNSLEFRNVATTRMTCPDIDTERSFLVALEEVATCSEGASADQATMKNSEGMPVLTLIRISPDQLEE